jgi:AcrR family transcriptional regulator
VKRKEKAAETEAALKDAAKRLFATRGYLNTKITDITAEAGRAAGSFYNHFASKEELLEALVDDLAKAIDSKAGEAEHSSDFSDPAAVRFHVSAYLTCYREHAATMRALRQATLVNPDFADKLSRFANEQTADIIDHLDQVTDLPAKPELTLALMTATVDGFTQAHPDLSDDETLEALTRFVYRGLNGKDY